MREESAIRDQYETLIQAQNEMGEGFVVVEDEKFIYANEAFCQLTGYSLTELRALPGAREVIVPETRLAILQRYRDRVGGQETIEHYETTLIRKGGRRVEAEVSVKMLPVGDSIRVIAIVRDVTERKEAEKAISESEEQLRAILDASPGAVYVKDLQGRYLLVNNKSEALIGLPREQILGKTDHEFLSKEVADALQANDLRVLKTGRPLSEEENLPQEDGARTFISTKFPLYDSEGNLYATCGISTDITEQRQAEEARSHMASVFEYAKESITGSTLEGIFTAWNRGAERIYGYTAEEMIGQSASVFVPSDRVHEISGTLEKIRRGQSVEIEDTVRVAKDGRRVPVSVTVSPIKDSQGNVTGLSTISRDITELKRAEETLRRSEYRYRNLFDRSHGGIAYFDMHGACIDANPSFLSMLGYTLEELQGVTYRQVTPARWADMENDILENQILGRGYSDEYEKEYIRKDGTVFPVSSRAWRIDDEEGNPIGLWGRATDITERKRAEEENNLLRTIALEVGEAEDLDSALRATLQKVCEVTGWVVGQAWVPSADGKVLLCSPAWYADSENLTEFRTVNKDLVFEPGVGLPGHTWSRKHPVWTRNITESNFTRARLAAEFGLKAAMDVPVLADSEVIAVLDFFVFEEREKDERLIELVSGVAAQLGTVIRRRRAEDALRESEERFRSLVQNSSDVILILKADNTVRYVSPSVERVLGYEPEDVLGKDNLAPLHPDDLARLQASIAYAVSNPGTATTMELRFQHADGAWRHLESTCTSLLDDPAVGGIVINSRDITERKAFEQQLEYQAFHDDLTDLPNRVLFLDRLEHALAGLERMEADKAVAVLFIDLDNFQVINDSLGHSVGDHLLTVVASRLRSSMRVEDTVARFGGDEFAVLLEDVEKLSDAVQVAEQISEELQTACTLEGREIFVSPSIGISLSTTATDLAEDLLRNADTALYRAKALGKARYAIFDSYMYDRVLKRLRMEGDLRRALERDELRVYYQPKIKLHTDLQRFLRASGSRAIVAKEQETTETPRIVGTEALVRWEHPDLGLMSPAEFIPVAEETGLIVRMGRWVLREACLQTRRWNDEHPDDPPLTVCVNLSARQFHDPGLCQDVTHMLQETGLNPPCLCLEVTESAVMKDVEVTTATLRELKALGVELAVDDFGTGYSSLSYLKRFPVDYLKIDRSFVAELKKDAEDIVLVAGIIRLAHTLSMQVVAEGVESAEQLERLQGLGCDLAQGFYFSEALTSEALTEFLPRARQR